MSLPTTTKDTAYAELVRFSLRAEAVKVRQTLGNRQSKPAETSQPTAPNKQTDQIIDWYSPSPNIPAPLESLRYRDKTALNELFEQKDLEAIILDVVTNLLWLWPEPCWEEDPYEFLEEFL